MFFRQGIEACNQLPRSEDTLAREIDLRFDLRSSLFPTSGIDRSLENSTQAERLARQLGDKRRSGWATAYLAKDLQLVGSSERSAGRGGSRARIFRRRSGFSYRSAIFCGTSCIFAWRLRQSRQHSARPNIRPGSARQHGLDRNAGPVDHLFSSLADLVVGASGTNFGGGNKRWRNAAARRRGRSAPMQDNRSSQ